jgi:thioredoxin-dependent peroxiredoxin
MKEEIVMKAKSFTLPDQNGKTHRLDDYRGKWLVLYFYPKDFTSGCTAQACSYRDFISEIRAKGAEVVGVSMDSVDSHKKFYDQYHLNFDILSDDKGLVVKDYGLFMGVGSVGVAKRTTYLIDPQGEIVKTYENVDPSKDATNILADLDKR